MEEICPKNVSETKLILTKQKWYERQKMMF